MRSQTCAQSPGNEAHDDCRRGYARENGFALLEASVRESDSTTDDCPCHQGKIQAECWNWRFWIDPIGARKDYQHRQDASKSSKRKYGVFNMEYFARHVSLRDHLSKETEQRLYGQVAGISKVVTATERSAGRSGGNLFEFNLWDV
jgi:hypothetical protein